MNNKIKSTSTTTQTLCSNFFFSPSPLWLGALLFTILGITFFRPIPPNDYWWYVRLGQDILQNHKLPSVDSYTYTQQGKPYIFNAWLSSVTFYLFQGKMLATLLHGVLVALFYGLIWKCCRTVGAGTRLAMLLTLFSAMVGTDNWAMRPQLFSYPLFALTLLCILQWRQGNSQWIWLLPIISLLWVNFHGAFPLLFLLTGAALVGGIGDRKKLAIAIFITFLTSLINPHGVFAWLNIFTVLNDHPTQISPEWLPPTIDTSRECKLFFIWLLAFPVLTTLSKEKITLTDWLWFFGFGWMALSGHRYIIWFLAIFVPINAILLTSLSNRTIDRQTTLGKPVLNAAIFAACLLLPLLSLPGIRERWISAAPPAYTLNTPINAVNWLNAHPELPGNMWSDLAMSVYLIYALPERPVWIDTRQNLFPLSHWSDNIDISKGSANWEKLLIRDNIKLLLLDPKKQPQLIINLAKSSNWTSPYQDDNSIIFTYVSQ